jgi:hypothetical protein
LEKQYPKAAALFVFDSEAYGGKQIGVEHVTNPGNHKNEDSLFFRKVIVLIHWCKTR